MNEKYKKETEQIECAYCEEEYSKSNQIWSNKLGEWVCTHCFYELKSQKE